ncbi:uncharacterized protein SCHCODRAFT_01349975 [Schizophyllum commune H4-8]|uniref:Uncharacterized protein n=1 Tax=Schizophyllum commune (strain H4-8 / FGSC 9210) TaxID=578458 RepID=D8PYE8_SCHCM|nr:uncharacterized protein SCHCODRAFT_01349975 [Schizophyllum commune H4-8]KAI5895925.1 hypothetical protein SCHCODRAFT_01349975 [Schizophyllum commune H4-8]
MATVNEWASSITEGSVASLQKLPSIPVRDGKTIYLARVDLHLIAGSEVVLDVDLDALKLLVNSQTSFIRRLFGVGSQSILAPSHTESGILPIAFRRLLLALGYLRYLLILPPTHFAGAAMRDSMALASASKPGWLNDLRIIVGRLCPALSARVRAWEAMLETVKNFQATWVLSAPEVSWETRAESLHATRRPCWNPNRDPHVTGLGNSRGRLLLDFHDIGSFPTTR